MKRLPNLTSSILFILVVFFQIREVKAPLGDRAAFSDNTWLWVKNVLQVGLQKPLPMVQRVTLEGLDNLELFWHKTLKGLVLLRSVVPAGQRTERQGCVVVPTARSPLWSSRACCCSHSTARQAPEELTGQDTPCFRPIWPHEEETRRRDWMGMVCFIMRGA